MEFVCLLKGNSPALVERVDVMLGSLFWRRLDLETRIVSPRLGVYYMYIGNIDFMGRKRKLAAPGEQKV